MKTPSNIPNYFSGKGIFFLIVVFLCSFYAKASIETSTNCVTGTSVATGVSVTAVDNKYSFIQVNPSTFQNTFSMASGVGRVRVGFDHSSLAYVSVAYNYSFTIQIKYQDQTLATPTTITTTLTAVYDPTAAGSYQDASLYEVAPGTPLTNQIIWINASITSIYDNIHAGVVTTVEPNMFLEASTVVERYYVMSYASVPSAGVLGCFAPHTNSVDSNEVQIHWNYISGAEQYQLEWTYVNDYNISGGTQLTDSLPYDFTHNSTRITTTAQHFNIPLIFDRGWLLFRLRAVTKAYDSGSGEWKYVYGKWTSDGVGSADTLDDYLSSLSAHSYHIIAAHDSLKNWQYVGTFAEEGKNKAVVSYYDGTLRNRQTVTKTSTDKKVLVGETFYDFQGRAAVTALPAPVPGDDQELKFYDGYNLVDSTLKNKSYSRYDFDVDISACESPTLGMKTTTGASNYYSTSNSETDFQQAYLPDAKKFPLAQVEYMPDNTGRIRQQGGVGPDHQLSSNHQTRYIYVQPFQEELDRLFGTDAGYKKHYNKTITVDANGQASVTYLDQEGRTIATALAGKNPYNLAPLVDASGDTLYKTNETSFTVDLLAKDTVSAADTDHDDNILSTDGSTLSLNTQFGVAYAQTYSFAYSLKGSKYRPGCLPMGTCYQCVYDMTIEVRDQCGNAMGGTPVRQKVGHFETDCSVDSATFTLTPGSLNIYLPLGSYTVTKTLTINDSALEDYWQDYLAQTTCTRTLESFVDSAEVHMDSSGCHLSNDDLGYISPCEASYLMMLSDVSPNGQYAQYLVQGSPAPSQYPVSVLNDGTNYLPLTNANWRNPIINGSADSYYEADGITISRIPLITIDLTTYTFNPAVENTGPAHSNLSFINGVWTIEPQYLANVSDFIAYWKSSWATSLVEYHPEYCYYNWCKGDMVGQYTGYDTLSSDEYDSLLLATNTIAEAHALKLLDPLGNAYASPNQANCKDPFFRAHGLGHFQYNNLSQPDACEYASNFQGSGISIYKFAKTANSCGTVYGDATDVDNCLIAALGSLPANDTLYITTDADWLTFRSLYLSIKQHFQNLQADSAARTCGEYNGCIGNEHYDPRAAGMFVGSPINAWPFYADKSPCGLYNILYTGKIQRFPNAENLVDSMSLAWDGNPQSVLDSMQSQGDYDFYMQTGQCPSAFALQNLLNALNSNGDLDGTGIALKNYPEFTPALYDAVTSHPSSFDPVDWTGSGSGSTLTGTFNWSGTDCNVTLIFAGGSSFSWSGLGSSFDIVSFSQLTSTGSGNFSILATIDDDRNPSTPPVTEYLTGNSGCFDVSCSFPEKCTPNEIGMEVYNLLNMLAADGKLYTVPTSTVCLTTGIYGSYFNTTQLKSILGGTGTYYWEETATNSNVFMIKNSISVHPNLTIRIPGLPLSGVTSFNNLVINNPDSTATVNAYDGSNHSVVFDLDWDHSVLGFVSVTSISLGTCGAIVPTVCEGDDYQRRTDLEAFLNQLAKTTNLAANDSTALYTFAYFTPLLGATFGPSTYYYADTIIGDSLVSPIVNYSTGDTTCNILLSFNSTPGGGNTWSDVNRIANLVADESNMVNGVAYSFTATAWFTDNSSMAITGTSCWGIRNCSICMANAGNKYQNFDSFNSGAPGFTTTLTYTVTCPGTNYYTVTKSATTLCSDATLTGEDHTQPGTGQYYYTHFSSNGAKTLWSTTTSVTAFTTYNFSAWYMNNWLDSAQNNVTLELWANGTKVAFTAVTDTAPGIWQKLQGVWNGTNTAGSITIEIKTSGGGAVDTRLGLDDIGFYTEGCGPQVVFALSDTTNHFPYCDSCRQNVMNFAIANGNAQYQQYMDSVQADFKAKYIAHCMGSAREIFTVTDTLREYHYTLYSYDQGGNLVRTIPPAGIVPVNLTTYGQAIKHERAFRTDNPTSRRYLYTAHTLATTYTYNSLNQLVQQVTPDGDTTRFWYDKLGRIVASQNAKQKAYSTPRYSYTIYDAQGRIEEVGELATSNNLRTASFATQQAWLNDYNYPDLLDGAVVSGSNYRYQVTKTFYDTVAFSSAEARFSNTAQENLRKRVSSAAIYELYSGTTTAYNSATHYSYDLHGNVQEMVQENTDLRDLDDLSNDIYQSYKNFKYEYDLVSGKVNEMKYNEGFADQYFYAYAYDADNRVTEAYTSTDGKQWDRDAKYFYYKHGPLARTEIAQDKVQGEDYAYTLHGWIKGVNSTKLTTINDMGLDADNFFTVNLNRYIGSDQYGYSLTYYDSATKTDYTQIAGQSWLASQAGSSLQTTVNNLWNGNIKNMVTSIEVFMPNGRPQGRDFRYDQLNRIVGAQADTNFVPGSNSWGTTGATTKWRERFTYDENGNITKLVRHGNVLTPMDSLNYHYNSNTNQLNYVDDAVSGGNYGDDVDDESVNNYIYDKIGNLVKDVKEEIDTIKWNVYGKIEKVVRSSTSSKSDLVFHYDATGNRICKIVKPRNGSGIKSQDNWTYTYYERDASGNVIAVYNRAFTAVMSGNSTESYSQKENDLYGSSRVGIRNTTQQLSSLTIAVSGTGGGGNFITTFTGAATGTALSTTIFNHVLGEKAYELVNHLGNVLVTVSDMRTANNVSTTVTGFNAVVLSATDYYAFGAPMEGQNFSSASYRYGFNGKEKMDEMHNNTGDEYDFGARIYDARLGRWMSTDPLENSYSFFSPYSYCANNPIFNIDIGGCYIKPADTYSDQVLREHWERMFAIDPDGDGKTESPMATLFENAEVGNTYQQGMINHKAYRKALRQLSPDQRALARGYYKSINSQNKMVILVHKAGEDAPAGTFGTAYDQTDYGSAAVLDEKLKSKGEGFTRVATTEFGKQITVVISDKPADEILVTTGSEQPGNGTGKSSLDERIAHEFLGHGLFESVFNLSVEKGDIAAIQMSNIVRRIEGVSERNGNDHESTSGNTTLSNIPEKLNDETNKKDEN